MNLQRRKTTQALAAALLLSPFAARAQAYPSKPIRMIVPFSAGGTTDVMGRIIAQHLSPLLGQQIVIDNRPGANGNIGTDMAAKSPPDGYTMVMSFDGTMAINPHTYKKLPFDPQRDLAPIINIGQAALVLVVHPSVQANTIQEFTALAKAAPSPLFFSSAGNGSTGHLAGELYAARAGTRMSHVSYKGGAPALQDLLAGQIQMLVTALPTVEALIANGKVRALAVTSAKRLSSLKNVPTLGEIYPGYEVASWYGLLAPAGTPAPIMQTLNTEINKVLARKDVQDRFETLGVELLGGSPQQFAATIKADTAKWAKVVKDANIQLD
ncbi:Bug family tripartite tricarboxylate transporter substrate binding protein [Ottowia thiooxydans]|uniref:Bug family tripartite tricarboxylate transporter substrate binding protein n=1 Tax=Ottowia thiooxydans TaxID=219182 RepID=UPI000428BC99|nr:tripartite tricarboxylate transporter substrate binding protein [Ottowia thiooxydans]